MVDRLKVGEARGGLRFPDSPLPELQHLSDVAFLQWQSLAKGGGLRDLRYVVQANIVNKQSAHIIELVRSCLRSRLQMPANWHPRLPRVCLTIGDKYAKLLLRTPNRCGQA